MNISSYRLEICYTPEKCYHSYAGPPSLVLQYVPEANQIWQSGSSPSTLVNQPISKGRESVRVLSGGGKNRRKEKRDPHESKVRYPFVFFVSVHALCIYFERIWMYRVARHRMVEVLSSGIILHRRNGDVNIWKMQIHINFHIRICGFSKILLIFI